MFKGKKIVTICSDFSLEQTKLTTLSINPKLKETKQILHHRNHNSEDRNISLTNTKYIIQKHIRKTRLFKHTWTSSLILTQDVYSAALFYAGTIFY